jgi:hypothetical protein
MEVNTSFSLCIYEIADKTHNKSSRVTIESVPTKPLGTQQEQV